MGKKKPAGELGNRERQIMDAVFQLGEATVSQVRELLVDPPSYSSVRTMLRHLESKGLLRHREDGKRYVYRPTQRRDSARKSAVNRVLDTFFAGSAADAVASILGDNSKKLTEQDLDKIDKIIEQARKAGRHE